MHPIQALDNLRPSIAKARLPRIVGFEESSALHYEGLSDLCGVRSALADSTILAHLRNGSTQPERENKV